MDELFEQMANISKAHAYDILSAQVKDLKDQNKVFREGISGVLSIISETDTKSIIDNPAGIITEIGKHCLNLLSKN